MKNKLLITTALVATILSENAYSNELIISDGDDITIETNDTYDSLLMTGGTLNVKGTIDHENVRPLIISDYFNLSSGTINLNASLEIFNTEKLTTTNLTGGIININEESPASFLQVGNGIFSDYINISGATINMNKSYLDTGDYSGAVNISAGSVNVLSGKAAEVKVNEEGMYFLYLTDGNYSETPEFNIKGGELNITENSGITIGIFKGNDKDMTFQKGTINLTDAGVINLSGTLVSNISGNGTINFNSNGGNINGSVNMTSGGIMNVGLNNAVIDGDVVFNSGSTLKLEIADSGNGSLQAANIVGQDGSTLALNITKKMAIGDTLENVALLKGNVDNHFTNEISNTRYKVTSTDGKNFDITYENTASDVASDIGGSAANAATAEAWDSINSSSSASEGAKAVASTLNELSQNATTPAGQKAYIDALTAVAPEVAPMVQKTQVETSNQVFGAVGTRLSGGSVSTGGKGMASGDSMFERAAMWVQGMFNKSKLDDTSKAKGFDADSSGVAFGFEKFVTDNTKAGIGYAYTKTDIDGFMRDTDVDTHTAIVYGEYKPNNWYVNGIATYGWSDYSEKKNVAGVNVKADYDVETLGLQAMTGYDMNVNGLGITPEAGLRYVHIKQDSYKDSADQRVSANDSDILTGVIGAKVSKDFELSNGMTIKPEARVAATYDLMNDDMNSVVTLANGSAYAVEGEALDRFGMEFGAGVTAEVNDNVELSLGYEGNFRQDDQDHTGLLNVKYKF